MRPRVPLIVVGLSMMLLLGSVAGAEASPNRGPSPAGGRIILECEPGRVLWNQVVPK